MALWKIHVCMYLLPSEYSQRMLRSCLYHPVASSSAFTFCFLWFNLPVMSAQPISSSQLRATLHYGQGPWPWNCVNAWTHPKAIPWKIETEISCGDRPFDCSVNAFVSRLSNECYFITILSMWAFLHKKTIKYQGLRDCELSWSPAFMLHLLLWGGLETTSGRPWNNIHCMPCREFHPFKLPWSLRPSSYNVMWSGAVLTFLRASDLRFQWSEALKR